MYIILENSSLATFSFSWDEDESVLSAQ